jgi:hypothetical protein
LRPFCWRWESTFCGSSSHSPVRKTRGFKETVRKNDFEEQKWVRKVGCKTKTAFQPGNGGFNAGPETVELLVRHIAGFSGG